MENSLTPQPQWLVPRVKVTVKVKVALEQVTKAQRGDRYIASTFLQLRRCGQCHAPAALPPGKTWHPLHKRLGGPQGRSERVRKISPPTGIGSPDRPARSESPYRLSYTGRRYPECFWYWFTATVRNNEKSVMNAVKGQISEP